jgi:pimeloyl-ACP methyl ester carboxylesterase
MMKRRFLQTIMAGLALLLASASANAAVPDLAGTWQVTFQDGIQRVLKIEHAQGSRYRAEMFNLGEADGHGPLNGYVISELHVQGDDISFRVDRIAGHFHGTLSDDGKFLGGTWYENSEPSAPTTWERATKKTAWVIDPSPHTSRMVQVDKDVSLEVLDWGGSGPPLVFLAGLGDTAHNFDKFAPGFTARHHVYGITRRGYGMSSVPPPTSTNYDSDRLGDDVLAVIAALKLDRPVIAGHSFAGAEMSSIGTRHPDKVSGLIYLDAAFDYAFYEPKVPQGFPYELAGTVHRDLEQLEYAGPAQTQALTHEILALLPALQEGLKSHAAQSKGRPEPPPQFVTQEDLIERAALLGMEKYIAIKAPFMVIAAVPHVCAPHCDSAGAKHDRDWTKGTADAIQADYPKARIVRLPFARHQVWNSNPADVAREMNAFMDGLKR